jgi:hypothetical protein
MSKNYFLDISRLSMHIEDDEYLMDGFSPSMNWSPSKFTEVYEDEDELTGVYSYRDLYELIINLGQDAERYTFVTLYLLSNRIYNNFFFIK